MFSTYDQRQQTFSTTPSGEQWPESLKKYASRCFSACTTTEDKDMVEIILKGKIAATAASNTLWSKDWSKEELPGVLCRKSSGGGGAEGGKSKVELERENRVLKESKRSLEKANQTLASKNESLNVLVEKLEERVKCPVCMEVPRFDPFLLCHSHVLIPSLFIIQHPYNYIEAAMNVTNMSSHPILVQVRSDLQLPLGSPHLLLLLPWQQFELPHVQVWEANVPFHF